MTTGYSWAAVNPAGVVAVLTMNPGKRPPAGLVTTIHPPLPWRLTNFSFPTIVSEDLILTKNLEIPDINFCCVAVRGVYLDEACCCTCEARTSGGKEMSLYRWLARTDGQVTGESWPTQADPPIVSGLSPPPPPMDLRPPHPLFREHHLMYGLGEQG